MDSMNVIKLYTLDSDWERLIHQMDIVPPTRKTTAELNKYTITINQPSASDAVITVKTIPDGIVYTNTFIITEGTAYTVYIVGANASNLRLSSSAGIANNNTTISAFDPTNDISKRCAIIIIQDFEGKQTIVGNINNGGFEQTKPIFVSPGSTAEFALVNEFERKWDLGKLNITSINPVVKNINYVYATPPKIKDGFDPTIAIITIVQNKNQVIHVYTEENGKTVDHTSTFTCKIGTTYTAQSIPSMWWTAGKLSIPIAGEFTSDTTVTVGTAYIQTDYSLDILIQRNNTNADVYGANVVYIWKPSETVRYGSITPSYIIDILEAYSNGGCYIAFWGFDLVTGLFKTFDASFIAPNGIEYQICKNIPNSKFGVTIEEGAGDVKLSASDIYDANSIKMIRSLANQHITLKLHISL